MAEVGAIGYIACVEGYFRLLVAHLIDRGAPFVDRISGFDQIRFGVREVVAFHSAEVTLGEYIAHLLPISSIADIDRSMSVLLGQDFLQYFKTQPVSSRNPKPFQQVFPGTIGEVEELFRLRHLFCHELATKEAVPVRKIERGVSSCASFITHTEEAVVRDFLR